MTRKIATLLLLISAPLLCFAGEQNEKRESAVLSFLKERVYVTGYAQLGYQYDSYDMSKGKSFNQFNLYRAMLIARVEPVRKLYVGFMGDVSRFDMHELFVEYRPFEAFGLKFGQYKTPFTIESNMSPAVTEIIRGAQAVYYLAGVDGSDACFGPGAGRDLGLMASGAFLKVGSDSHNLFEYSVGVFSGEPMNTRETNNFKDLSAMLAVSPVKGLKFVGSCYFGHSTSKTDNIYGAFLAGETYRRTRWSAGVDFRYGPLYVRSEYLEGYDDSVHSRGAYLTATGKVWKGLDVIASADYLDRNIAVSDWQCNYILGLQWNIAYRCRIQLQYVYQQRSSVSTGYFSGVPSSHLVISQVQVGF